MNTPPEIRRYVPIPTTFLFLTYLRREMTFDALEGMQALARRILGRMPRGAWIAFESQALNLTIGGAVPLFGILELGWPARLLFIGIVADNATQWLLDVVKPLFNSREFSHQWARQCEVLDAVSAARIALTDDCKRDGFGTPYYQVVDKPMRGTPYVSRDYLRVGMFFFVVPVFSLCLFLIGATPQQAWQLLPVLAVPFCARVLLACIALVPVKLGLQRDPRSRALSLLPQAPESIATFYLSVISYMGIGLVMWGNFAPTWYWGFEAPAYFICYLVWSIGVALFSLRKRREAEVLLRQFAAMTSEQLYDVLRPHRAGVQDVSH